MKEERDDRKYNLLLSGACGAILWLSRPYDGLNLFIIIMIYTGIIYYKQKLTLNNTLYYLIPLFICVPFIIYNYLTLGSADGFKNWSNQAIVPPVLPLNVLFTMGLFTPLLIYSLKLYSENIKERLPLFLFLTLITVISMFYSYPIFVFSGQYGAFLTTAVMLFCFVMCSGKIYNFAKQRPLIFAVLLIINSLTSVYFVWNKTDEVIKGQYSLKNEIVQGYDWLAANTDKEDTVLADMRNSAFLFRFSKNRVFYGHHSQTLHINEKREIMGRFFNGETSDDYREEVLKTYNIKYLFYGPDERLLGSYKPNGSTFLKPVFSNQLITIFKIT
jgi:hypothetical protein